LAWNTFRGKTKSKAGNDIALIHVAPAAAAREPGHYVRCPLFGPRPTALPGQAIVLAQRQVRVLEAAPESPRQITSRSAARNRITGMHNLLKRRSFWAGLFLGLTGIIVVTVLYALFPKTATGRQVSPGSPRDDPPGDFRNSETNRSNNQRHHCDLDRHRRAPSGVVQKRQSCDDANRTTPAHRITVAGKRTADSRSNPRRARPFVHYNWDSCPDTSSRKSASTRLPLPPAIS
jgi:hypothetical protein